MTEGEISSMEEPVSNLVSAMDNICQEDEASPISVNLRERQKKINSLMAFIRSAAESRRKALEDSLEASKKFWPGIDKLQTILHDVKTSLDSEDEPRIDPSAIQDLQHEHEVRPLCEMSECMWEKFTWLAGI